MTGGPAMRDREDDIQDMRASKRVESTVSLAGPIPPGGSCDLHWPDVRRGCVTCAAWAKAHGITPNDKMQRHGYYK